MLITPKGVNWQPTLHQPQRANDEQALAQFAQAQAPVATSHTAAQQQSQGNSAQQNAEDHREEAFAKLKVALQNPELAARQQASADTQATSSALQEFRDYMAKSPGEMIKEKLLREIGMTEEEYNALPPEMKTKIDELIAQRMKDDMAHKTQAKIEQQIAEQEGASDEQGLTARQA